LARLQGILWHWGPAKVIWNNCIVPTRNATSDPAKYSRQVRVNFESNMVDTCRSTWSYRTSQCSSVLA
jgi:hypothetical protein